MIRNIKTFLVEKTFFLSLEQRKAIPEATSSKTYGPVITISRQHGCYGAETAVELSHFLGRGWVVFHREILEAIAKDSGVEKEYLRQFDEKTIPLIEEIVNGFYKPHLSDTTYLTYLKKFLSSLASRGKVIIVGRGANFILKEGFHVRLVASLPVRIKRLIELNKYSKSEAEQEIEEADRQRRAYIKKLFGVEVDDPLNYDLIINTDDLTFSETAKIIFEATKVSSVFK